MRVTAEVASDQLADLVKQVQAGDEVVLTQGNKPVAKIVPAAHMQNTSGRHLKIHPLQGHQVLTPNISQSELADEMFGNK